jgi:DNA-binding HxlR family transcriptional regulator
MECTVHRAAGQIAKRWSLEIVLELHKRQDRYNEIKRKLGKITPRVLSMRLKELESLGIISKTVDSSSAPISCTYSLTKSGNDLVGVLKELKKWGNLHKLGNRACLSMDCRDCEL